MASSTTIAGTLAYFAALYPGEPISAATADAWSLALDDISDDSVRDAAQIVAREAGRTFRPTVGELRKYLPPPKPMLSLANPDDHVAKYYAGQTGLCLSCGGRKGMHDPSCRSIYHHERASGPSRTNAGPDVAEPITAAQEAEWNRVKASLRLL